MENDIRAALKTGLSHKAVAEAYGVGPHSVAKIAGTLGTAPRKGTRFSDAEKAAVLADADATSVGAAAKKHGVGADTLRNWRKETGESAPPAASQRRYSDAERAAIVADAQATNVEQASRKHNVAGNTIRYWLNGKKSANGNGHVSATVHVNGKGNDLIAAVNGVLRLLEPLSPTQRLKLLDTARGLVA